MGNTAYLAADAKLPYCRGCGHALVVRQLSRALEGLALASRSIVLTTDIGCVGLADSLFPYLHTVHTTHGRSTAMAIGMALADAVLPASGLKPIVMIGDGGAMIGLLHLVHAAQLNLDITVLVHNNFLFGMTGGQHSAFTPLDWSTTTTPEGNRVPPLDLLALLRAAHAGFLARQFATDCDLNAVIADAIAYPGFSLVEILEICTGYGGLKDKSKGVALHEVAGHQGHAIGRLIAERPRPTFTQLYRCDIESKMTPLLAKEGPGVVDLSADAATHHPLPPPPAEEGNRLHESIPTPLLGKNGSGVVDVGVDRATHHPLPPPPADAGNRLHESKPTPRLRKEGSGVVDVGVDRATHHPLPPPPAEEGSAFQNRKESRSASLRDAAAADSRFEIQESKPMHIVIAGTAGERVQSSAALLCRAALSAGLYTTQKNDNPVTQGSGFSLSEICLSPQPVQYTGIENADVVIAVSQDGWNELKANGTLDALTPGSLLVLDSELESGSPTGQPFRQPFRHDATPKRAALAAVAFWLGKKPVFPNAAWHSVLAALPIERRTDVSEALRIGANLARQGGAPAA